MMKRNVCLSLLSEKKFNKIEDLSKIRGGTGGIDTPPGSITPWGGPPPPPPPDEDDD